ncbi:MAG: DinB family protein [Acidimicrobiales bacterium]
MGNVQTDEHGRPEPPHDGDEAATLLGFLDFQRATLEWKCRGLSDEQLRVALSPTSMTLGGMLKHLAYVEDYWFTDVAAGEPAPAPWADVDWEVEPDWEWRSAGGDPGDELRALWADRVSRSRAVVATRLDQGGTRALGEAHAAWGGQGHVSLRWILVHMVEEYARHNGHADLIRESIDGQTGE